VTGVEPSQGFLDVAADALRGRAALRIGSATSIPLGDATADAVVSGLVLNFVTDVPAAMNEMSRVVFPGGTVAAYVWDYAERMELIRRFWDVASSLDPAAASLHEGARFPICGPEALRATFVDAGLNGVEVTALDTVAVFADFDDYWQPFLGGQGPRPRTRCRSTRIAGRDCATPCGYRCRTTRAARSRSTRGRGPCAARADEPGGRHG
jgi:SAM-dependent methyltransferase